MMFQRIRYSVITLSFLLLAHWAFPQQKEMREAYNDFTGLQFHTALGKYLDALDKMDEDEYQQRNFATYMVAECYRLMNDYEQAEVYYKDLVESEFGKSNPVIYLRWADVLRMKGEADRAKEYYEKYLKEDPRSQYAKLGVQSCNWMMANAGKRARVNVNALNGLNSPADDFAPAFLNDSFSRLLITSNRMGAEGKKTDEWYGAPFSDLFMSELQGGSWAEPVPIDLTGTINTETHEGTACFNHDHSRMYFTRCERWDEKKRFCAILVSERSDTSWSEPAVLFADTSANFGHPALSSDELTILFSSNIKGGEGGKDLYAATRMTTQEAFGKPVSLGTAVNSFGDEMFPFLFKDTVLYFASDGFPGYGGLDIFKSVMRDGKWSKPENLLKPVNSGYDDFSFVLTAESAEGYMEEGLFSSNRPGGKGGDELYRLERRKLLFTLSGQVKDNMTLLPVPGAEISLTREDGERFVETTDASGKYHFGHSVMMEDSDYELSVRKDNYFAFVGEVSTNPFSEDHNITKDVILEPIPEKPIVLPDILYPLDQWILLPQYQDSLRGLVRLMTENPTLVIELRSHTDSRASYEYNDVLSQKRAQSVVDFLIGEGIEAGRMVAKGYGERVFRLLDRDITREGHTFKKGTLLDDEYIYSLPGKEIQEAAFQLNRRTEFAVIAKDYRSTGQAAGGKTPVIEVVSDSTVQAVSYTLSPEGDIMVFSHINDFKVKTVIKPGEASSVIGEEVALDLLRKGAINRNDFEGDYDEIMKDGRIQEGAVLKASRIRLGDRVVKDAILTVSQHVQDRVIMGEALFSGFGESRIDTGTQQIIFK